LQFFRQIEDALDRVSEKMKLRNLDLLQDFRKKGGGESLNTKVLADLLGVATMYGVHALWFTVVKVAVENYASKAGKVAAELAKDIQKKEMELVVYPDSPGRKSMLQILKDAKDDEKVVIHAANVERRMA
jgi:hypothetical protein